MPPFPGLSAFPITPCDSRGRVDAGALRGLLARLTHAGVDSIGLLGSTGSYPYLSRAERRRAIEIAAAHVDGTPLLVGIGALRTDETVRLAGDALAAGASGGLLAAVSYQPLTDDEVFAHFAAVARASDLPLYIYDNPAATHFAFSADLIARIAELPGVVGLKTSSAGPFADPASLRSRVPTGFALGHSGDARATEALLAGSDAWFSVTAGLLPEPCVRLMRAVREKDEAEIRRLNDSFAPLWTLFAELSPLRVTYAAADILGLCAALPPRPVLPLPEPARRRVREVLDGLGPE